MFKKQNFKLGNEIPIIEQKNKTSWLHEKFILASLISLVESSSHFHFRTVLISN